MNDRLPKNAERWVRLGPYYGMFPVGFAQEVIEKYTDAGDEVLDPFAGRGTSIAVAAALERRGLGVEIVPVAWLYGRVKLAPASKETVLKRLDELEQIADDNQYQVQAKDLPEFYHWCFCERVQRFLLAARDQLDWRNRDVDATLMAFIVHYLHGKRGQAFSNQMSQPKSLAPDYSVRWWKKREMRPPDIVPKDFLEQRIRWRYEKGVLPKHLGEMRLGDSRNVLPSLPKPDQGYKLLITSPPYYDVTDYYYDHWLRDWLLGGPVLPTQRGSAWRREGRHDNQERYRNLLKAVFQAAARLMAPGGVVYVRTDARPFTFKVTLEALQETFPGRDIQIQDTPFRKPTQTAIFGNAKSKKKGGEYDLVLCV